jgi:hypothetical protein
MLLPLVAVAGIGAGANVLELLGATGLIALFWVVVYCLTAAVTALLRLLRRLRPARRPVLLLPAPDEGAGS